MVRRFEIFEARVRQALERKFGLPFQKTNIDLRGLSKEFDAVSPEGEIVALIKAFEKPFDISTPAQLDTRLERCIADCAWLAATNANRRLLVLDGQAYADWFRSYCKVLFPSVETTCLHEIDALSSLDKSVTNQE